MLKKAPHRHFVFSIPKILRKYFLFNRSLLKELSKISWEILNHYYQNTRRKTGGKTAKKYDIAKTPFRRVLKSKYIDDKIKVKLKRQYGSLNPAELKRKITKLQDKLIKLNFLKKTLEGSSIIPEVISFINIDIFCYNISTVGNNTIPIIF